VSREGKHKLLTTSAFGWPTWSFSFSLQIPTVILPVLGSHWLCSPSLGRILATPHVILGFHSINDDQPILSLDSVLAVSLKC
jgi:hypothetical protein